MRRLSVGWVLVSVCALAGAFAACSGGEEGTAGAGDPDALAPDGGGDGSSGFNPDGTVGEKKIVKLAIAPATASIEVVNGDVSVPSASVGLSAVATFDDGSTGPVASGTWTVDRIDVGTMTGSTFKASGNAGGVANVELSALGLKATAKITVTLKDVIDDGTGLDETSKKDLLAAATSDPKVTKLLYPYDATVFPKGIAAPELMWTGDAASDVYALRLEQPGYELVRFFKPGLPSRGTIPAPSWARLLDTNVTGGPVKLTLSRLAGGAGGIAFKSATQTWTIANGSLKGTIYYWRINGGRVVRIRPGASTFEDFLKPSAGHGCIACHSVSKDGSTIAGAYDGGWSPWVTFDAKTGNEIHYSGTASGFQAISPDGALVVAGQSGGPMGLRDAKTGASYEPSGIGDVDGRVMPTFSNDGKSLAYSVRKDGNWLDFTQSDLALSPFDPVTKKFGASKLLRASGGRALIYPSFSPDDAWIAYQDGPLARTRGTRANLHLIKADGTGDVVLAQAVDGGVAAEDKDLAYEPTFNPVITGGYFWLVFVSERQYGNRLNKTLSAPPATCEKPSWAATPCRHKQLWVTAIDASPKPGADPSHPAFWLPGQDLADQNMRGYWALDPCKKDGEGCEAGFECCDGACRSPDGTSPKVCSKPPPGTCAPVGDKCTTATDCCDAAFGVECIGGVCGKKAPS